MSDGVYSQDHSSWQPPGRVIQDALDASFNERFRNTFTTIGRSATQTSAELAKLMKTLQDLESKGRRFVIHEEPEFIWESGSNFEPECAKAARPR